MKKFLLLIIVVLSVFLIGCDDIGNDIAMDIFGPFAGSGGSRSSSSSSSSSTGASSANTSNLDVKCGSNEFYNKDKNKCECVDNYFMQNGKCVPESSKECIFDSDCSPTSVASSCKDKYTKQVYRCDIRTNKCVNGKGNVAETIDCRIDFGKNAVCQGGSCFSIDPYNPIAP
ncbi:MAG: hypothetical protein ACP5OA_06800 [Candidatus Woesearchaeota archaeon]